MKKYKYTGGSILSFTYDGKDYVVHGVGPHELPEDSDIVKTHVLRKTLVEVESTLEVVEQPAPAVEVVKDKPIKQ